MCDLYNMTFNRNTSHYAFSPTLHVNFFSATLVIVYQTTLYELKN